MKLSSREINSFQNKILTWFAKNKRDLPWRHTRDPYRIWVSEIMLQQTQVVRVIPKYDAWLEKFPTVESLANARTSDVLRLWSGLGYNRRALNLQRAAMMLTKGITGTKSITSIKGRQFPRTIEDLKRLPGVGEYTARAILCFAFDEQIAVVDTNVRKVILLEVLKERKEGNAGKEKKGRKEEKAIQAIADRLLPRGKAYEWNQALMDYASAVLKKEKIPIPKQSRFIGSNRYYRGNIIRALLQEKEIGLDRLQAMVKEDYQASDQEWFEDLLSQLEKEGFLTRKTETVTLRMHDVE